MGWDSIKKYDQKYIQKFGKSIRVTSCRTRTSKYVYVELHQRMTQCIAVNFLGQLIKAVPYKVHIVLTDNGI